MCKQRDDGMFNKITGKIWREKEMERKERKKKSACKTVKKIAILL